MPMLRCFAIPNLSWIQLLPDQSPLVSPRMPSTSILNDIQEQLDTVQPYSMHVSSRYLELTNKKLQLTRLPREIELPEHQKWVQGTPKSVLEPLLDYWLEHYDWRTQEALFNSTLPQYRTTITLPSTLGTSTLQSLRVHFIHKRSKDKNAIPLLFCHSWPSSFIEVQKIIDALVDPHTLPSFGTGAHQAFHLVVPSIPGFGFSDASLDDGFGLRDTAKLFHELMIRLGYEYYVCHGSGGFNICRAIALSHPKSCLAVHTTNPSFTEPSFTQSPLSFLKYRIAKCTRARIPLLSFGYTPAEVQWSKARASDVSGASGVPLYAHRPAVGSTLSRFYSLRPQTLSFSLCDSPVGLLASMLDIMHARLPVKTQLGPRSRSPLLAPGEAEMQDAPQGGLANGYEGPRRERKMLTDMRQLQWLPGPEGSLRWLRRAHADSSPGTPFQMSYCTVPLGISSFQARSSSSSSNNKHGEEKDNKAATSPPVMWGSSSWNLAWVKRHQRRATVAAWEAADLVVLDVRECFGTLLSHRAMGNLPLQAG
ncbi:alpha/beta-hydrolase [Corynespora cassiicola Philippines]|uniref:Alpha/beta-hydrolase n=1 Tax=Corynespora cassiicola Philippines TaxID=1448308 RepID=A0A2T2P9U4_CORCC|nr:alpha/beta-hydrolase [Corynespora cassiicola Philippines]